MNGENQPLSPSINLPVGQPSEQPIPVRHSIQPSPEPPKSDNKKNSLFLGVGIFLVLGLIITGVIFWKLLGKQKEARQFVQPSPAPGFQITEEMPTQVPSPQLSPERTSGSGGIPLIGSSQKLIGVATAMRNLAGMLVQINQIDACGFPLLKVYATITDKEGKPFTDVRQTDFAVSEDGQEIKEFTMSNMATETIPLSIALVVDHSGSMKGEPMAKAKEAAIDFVNKLKPQDNISLIQFDTEIELLQSTTSDKTAVISKIDSIAPRSDTALYDVVHFAAQNLSGCGRKAVVLLTDGRDTASKQFSLQQSINKANQVNVPVFVVGLKSYQFTPEILRQIAEQTGAQYFEAPTPAELAAMYRKICGQLEGQHKFEFQSDHSKDAQEHRIRLGSQILGSDTSSEKSYLAQ